MNVVPAAPLAPPLVAVAPLPDVPVAVLPAAPPAMRAFASMNVLPVFAPADAVAPAPLVVAPALACVPGRTQPVTITVCDWPAALRVVEPCEPGVELLEPWLPAPGLRRSDWPPAAPLPDP